MEWRHHAALYFSPSLNLIVMNDPFFNKDEDIRISHTGFLPHWDQSGKIQFVTFRLIDSLPYSKICELTECKQRFIATNPQPWNSEVQREYYKEISPLESKLLDNGYGDCILKNPDIRKIVSEALRYMDGLKYSLLAYVIMPNHVHVLFQMMGDNDIEAVMHSLKSYTSKQINKYLGQTGPVWMREYFDRIVRSKSHLNNCVNYILSNPRHLKENEYEVFVDQQYNV